MLNSDCCLRVGLYGYFCDDVSPQTPAHLCCSTCKGNCHCSDNGDCLVNDTLPYNQAKGTCGNVHQSTSQPKSRTLNQTDKNDLKLALQEVKKHYAAGVSSIFHEETINGFTDKVIEDIVDQAHHIFSADYLTENLAIYSSRQVIDILEIFQELFDDIEQYEQEMEILHLVNNELCQTEGYLLAKSMSELGCDEIEDLQLPEFDFLISAYVH